MSAPTASQRLNVTDIAKLHADGQRFAMLTAYDYPTAKLLDEAGIPVILVGDSLGTVLLGYDSEIRVTMADMLHHTAAVVRGTSRALVVGDMPFLSYSTPTEAVENAGRFLREAGAQAVKIEGGVRSARIVEALVRAGIPVMGHIGWTPQAKHALGGKVRVQGKTTDRARNFLADALAIQEAGAFSIVVELVPEQLAGAITQRLRIPTIGIGRARAAAARSRSSPTCWAGATGTRSTRSRTPTCARPSWMRRRRMPTRSPRARSPGRSRPSGWTTRRSTRCSVGPLGPPPGRRPASAASRSTATSDRRSAPAA